METPTSFQRIGAAELIRLAQPENIEDARRYVDVLSLLYDFLNSPVVGPEHPRVDFRAWIVEILPIQMNAVGAWNRELVRSLRHNLDAASELYGRLNLAAPSMGIQSEPPSTYEDTVTQTIKFRNDLIAQYMALNLLRGQMNRRVREHG